MSKQNYSDRLKRTISSPSGSCEKLKKTLIIKSSDGSREKLKKTLSGKDPDGSREKLKKTLSGKDPDDSREKLKKETLDSVIEEETLEFNKVIEAFLAIPIIKDPLNEPFYDESSPLFWIDAADNPPA